MVPGERPRVELLDDDVAIVRSDCEDPASDDNEARAVSLPGKVVENSPRILLHVVHGSHVLRPEQYRLFCPKMTDPQFNALGLT